MQRELPSTTRCRCPAFLESRTPPRFLYSVFSECSQDCGFLQQGEARAAATLSLSPRLAPWLFIVAAALVSLCLRKTTILGRFGEKWNREIWDAYAIEEMRATCVTAPSLSLLMKGTDYLQSFRRNRYGEMSVPQIMYATKQYKTKLMRSGMSFLAVGIEGIPWLYQPYSNSWQSVVLISLMNRNNSLRYKDMGLQRWRNSKRTASAMKALCVRHAEKKCCFAR